MISIPWLVPISNILCNCPDTIKPYDLMFCSRNVVPVSYIPISLMTPPLPLVINQRSSALVTQFMGQCWFFHSTVPNHMMPELI